MASRQVGIASKLIAAVRKITDELIPGFAISGKTVKLCNILAEALTQTYDSGNVTITGSGILEHKLGYTPSVTIIGSTGVVVNITSLDDNQLTVSVGIYSGSPAVFTPAAATIRVLAH